MKRRATIVLSLSTVLLVGASRIEANELQRLVFNAGGNIGVTEAIVQSQGITPANSASVNNYINTAITMLDQLVAQYNDPPFDSGQIRSIASMLRRFPQATESLNNDGKATYLQNCYSNLKAAMSTIFRSDLGLKHGATCDTYVAELGYHTGWAMAGSLMGNAFLENMGKSGINQALGAGARTRDTLGCSFLTEDQARSLNVPNLKTPQDYAAMIRSLETDVRMASLNMEPGFDSPATKGTVSPIPRVDPPPSNPPSPPSTPGDLTGDWRMGLTKITREGGYYVARRYDETSNHVGYRKGMVVLRFAEQRDPSGYHYGQTLLFSYRDDPIWLNAVIERSYKPETGQELLRVHYTHPLDGKKTSYAISRYHRTERSTLGGDP